MFNNKYQNVTVRNVITLSVINCSDIKTMYSNFSQTIDQQGHLETVLYSSSLIKVKANGVVIIVIRLKSIRLIIIIGNKRGFLDKYQRANNYRRIR